MHKLYSKLFIESIDNIDINKCEIINQSLNQVLSQSQRAYKKSFTQHRWNKNEIKQEINEKIPTSN